MRHWKKRGISLALATVMLICSTHYGSMVSTAEGMLQGVTEETTDVVTESTADQTTEKQSEQTTEKKTTEKKTTEKKTTEKKTTEKKTTEQKADQTEVTTETAIYDDTQAVGPSTNPISDAEVQQAVSDAEEAAKRRQEAQEILDNLEQAKSNIEEYITQLDQSLNEIQSEIIDLERNQTILQDSIKETQGQLEEAKKAQMEQYEAMKLRIQMVYESGQIRYLDVLLTANSMADMLNKTEYVNQVSLYDYNLLSQLKAAKEKVANLKQKLDKDLEVNETLQAEVNAQKDVLETLLAEKQQQVIEYTESIRGQEEEVARYTRAQQEAESIITAAELEAASSSATSVYSGGIFVWPVPGYTQITSYFGNRNSPVAGASTYHKGIDIACSSGASVVAAAPGTVLVANYNYAEGNYVCIDHGGGVVTVYMHNSSLLVSVGDTVSAAQPIALAGSTGVSTGPHCHFGVRVDGEYVDPLLYLQ